MRNTTCAVLLLLVVAFSAPVRAEGTVASLAAARDLYISAAYDEALSMLSTMSAGARTDEERQSIDLYRTLCLFALGRTVDADKVIEVMLLREPLYRAGSGELSPRVQAAFQSARKRILPALIQQEYTEAKTAFDNKKWDVATAGFDAVLKSIADPDMAPVAGMPPLSDLKTLAAGFRDLSVKMIPPPAPKPEPKPIRPAKSIYSADDRDVIPPMSIELRVPKYPAVVNRPLMGIVQFIVDESGAVQAPSMQLGIDPTFDQMVINAAQKWQYQPATLDGKPVKYLKRLTISVAVSPGR